MTSKEEVWMCPFYGELILFYREKGRWYISLTGHAYSTIYYFDAQWMHAFFEFIGYL